MIHAYSRKLDNTELIHHFLSVVLKHANPGDKSLLNKIRTGEAELKNYDGSEPTLTSAANRDREYASNDNRWKLREQVVNELIELLREENDDEITLGKGGAVPESGIKSEKQAIIIIGLPASGKSSIANTIADQYGAVILDSDFAKRKLPEFKDSLAGVSLVHSESDALIFGYDGNDKPDGFRSLIEICSANQFNIVVPKIGYDPQSLNNFAKGLKIFGYSVHLVLVSLDRRKATLRAVSRFQKTDRYVPLSLIFDGYGNDPVLSFYRLKDKILPGEIFIDSFGKLSSDVPRNEDPVVLYSDDQSPVVLFK